MLRSRLSSRIVHSRGDPLWSPCAGTMTLRCFLSHSLAESSGGNKVSESHFSSGTIAVFASYLTDSKATEQVAFNDVKVWAL